jgi:hypothetical protein
MQPCACKKYKIDVRDVNQEPLTFCTWRCVCKKYKIDVKRCQSGAPCFLYALVRWLCVGLKVSPCVNQKCLLLVGHVFINHQECVWLHSPIIRWSGVTQYLAGAKHLTRSGTCHLFLETYRFRWSTDKPLRSIDRKIKSYTNRCMIRNVVSLLIR